MAQEPLHNEKQLLQKISEGDDTAFRHLFDRYYGQIYTASFRYLKVHELAEDLVQSSFLKIWEKRNQLSHVERFDHYLFRIAHNEMADHFRKHSRRDLHIQRIREMFEEETGSPEELLITKQKRALIADVISNLPPQQQTAYKLSRDEGLSYQEIAERMHLSVNTIKVHISQALKTLKIFFASHKDEYLVWLLILSVPAGHFFTSGLIHFLN
ncbi:MAG TPA: RNA polymerase sigma-70 factor [Puia sp.]|nr:RNA polymerase sigma-70 factor [Puia sp.]